MANFFLVEVQVNGRGPFRFIVDTGSSTTLVSPTLAASLARISQGQMSVSAATGSVELAKVGLQSIRVGATELGVGDAGVFDFGPISNQLGLRVDGLLGFDAFRNVQVALDYAAARIDFVPSGTPIAGADVLSLAVVNGRPFIPLAVGGATPLTLIDTGSDAMLSFNADEPRVRFTTAARITGLNATMAGDVPQVLRRLADDVTIGERSLVEPLVEITPGPTSIGGGVLRHFRVTIDAAHGAIAFVPYATGPIEVDTVHSVGVVFDRGVKVWTVAALLPERTGETSLVRKGDVCVRVNGEPTQAWPIERYRELLRNEESVRFTFATEDGLREVKLPVFAVAP